ncbi:CBS domain protein [hydrothermal vent metagenome]|uniref:CBS domain protein n=1 Tax=hydrothermal vent metagenome TaxID=652676 RepID=A0A3B0U364_9ZZZZ
MTVLSILGNKGNNVITLPPTASLSEVCETLAKKRIGAVLIVDGAKIAGIISERDIVRKLAAAGAGALDSAAADCMTKKLVTCTRSDTIPFIMEKMTEGRFRHIPVVEDGKLVGVISIGDVVKHRIAEVEREADELRSYISAT